MSHTQNFAEWKSFFWNTSILINSTIGQDEAVISWSEIEEGFAEDVKHCSINASDRESLASITPSLTASWTKMKQSCQTGAPTLISAAVIAS